MESHPLLVKEGAVEFRPFLAREGVAGLHPFLEKEGVVGEPRPFQEEAEEKVPLPFLRLVERKVFLPLRVKQEVRTSCFLLTGQRTKASLPRPWKEVEVAPIQLPRYQVGGEGKAKN